MTGSLILPQVFTTLLPYEGFFYIAYIYILLDKPLNHTKLSFLCFCFKIMNHHQVISDNNVHTAMENFLYGIKYSWSYKAKILELGRLGIKWNVIYSEMLKWSTIVPP